MSPHVSIDRAAVSAFCQRHHIARLALFGSVLHDDFRPDSDIDVLVEFQPGHVPGLKFMSIEREFSGLVQGRRAGAVLRELRQGQQRGSHGHLRRAHARRARVVLGEPRYVTDHDHLADVRLLHGVHGISRR